MKVMHFHFGKDGGAERFFVHMVNALAKRDVSQKVIIRPKRTWREEIENSAEITESYFRTASLDRILLPSPSGAPRGSGGQTHCLRGCPKGGG